MDQGLITLTHVCHGWRDTFVSRSSLWTRLSFEKIDKTSTYIERSQSSPLKFFPGRPEVIEAVLPLMIPHIPRLKTLTIDAGALPGVLDHFHCSTPLLEELEITPPSNPALDDAPPNGDLSSLRELRLGGAITLFPW